MKRGKIISPKTHGWTLLFELSNGTRIRRSGRDDTEGKVVDGAEKRKRTLLVDTVPITGFNGDKGLCSSQKLRREGDKWAKQRLLRRIRAAPMQTCNPEEEGGGGAVCHQRSGPVQKTFMSVRMGSFNTIPIRLIKKAGKGKK